MGNLKPAIKISVTITGDKLDKKAKEIIQYVCDNYDTYFANYHKVQVV